MRKIKRLERKKRRLAGDDELSDDFDDELDDLQAEMVNLPPAP